MPWGQNGNFHPLSLLYLKIIFVKNSITVIVVHVPEISLVAVMIRKNYQKVNPQTLIICIFKNPPYNKLDAVLPAVGHICCSEILSSSMWKFKEKWLSFPPDVCPCEFVYIRFLDFEGWRHRQPHTTIMRYESSTPTSQELSSPIFQSMWVRHTWRPTNYPFFLLYKSIKAPYWPSTTKN